MNTTLGTHDLALLAGFVIFGLFTIAARIYLFLRLRRHIPSMSIFLSLTLGYVEFEYLRNRRRIGNLGLDVVALSAAASFVLGVACAVLLYGRVSVNIDTSKLRGT